MTRLVPVLACFCIILAFGWVIVVILQRAHQHGGIRAAVPVVLPMAVAALVACHLILSTLLVRTQ